MFDHFSVIIESENINSRIIVVTWPMLMAVQYDKVALGNSSDNFHMFARILPCHTFEILNEGLNSIADIRVVLNVRVANKALYCLTRPALVKHECIELFRRSLISFLWIHSFNAEQRSPKGVRLCRLTGRNIIVVVRDRKGKVEMECRPDMTVSTGFIPQPMTQTM